MKKGERERETRRFIFLSVTRSTFFCSSCKKFIKQQKQQRNVTHRKRTWSSHAMCALLYSDVGDVFLSPSYFARSFLFLQMGLLHYFFFPALIFRTIHQLALSYKLKISKPGSPNVSKINEFRKLTETNKRKTWNAIFKSYDVVTAVSLFFSFAALIFYIYFFICSVAVTVTVSHYLSPMFVLLFRFFFLCRNLI